MPGILLKGNRERRGEKLGSDQRKEAQVTGYAQAHGRDRGGRVVLGSGHVNKKIIHYSLRRKRTTFMRLHEKIVYMGATPRDNVVRVPIPFC